LSRLSDIPQGVGNFVSLFIAGRQHRAGVGDDNTLRFDKIFDDAFKTRVLIQGLFMVLGVYPTEMSTINRTCCARVSFAFLQKISASFRAKISASATIIIWRFCFKLISLDLFYDLGNEKREDKEPD